jgi:hypothetical protein
MTTAMKVAASENSAMRRAQTASREIGASVNWCRRIQGVLSLGIVNCVDRRPDSQRHYICPDKIRLGLKCGQCVTSVVKKAIDLDLNAFARRTAMTNASGEKSACLLFGLSFDAPFLDPRDQHPGVEQAGFCLGRDPRNNPGRA